jgi:hypothetical protein
VGTFFVHELRENQSFSCCRENSERNKIDSKHIGKTTKRKSKGGGGGKKKRAGSDGAHLASEALGEVVVTQEMGNTRATEGEEVPELNAANVRRAAAAVWQQQREGDGGLPSALPAPPHPSPRLVGTYQCCPAIWFFSNRRFCFFKNFRTKEPSISIIWRKASQNLRTVVTSKHQRIRSSHERTSG